MQCYVREFSRNGKFNNIHNAKTEENLLSQTNAQCEMQQSNVSIKSSRGF